MPFAAIAPLRRWHRGPPGVRCGWQLAQSTESFFILLASLSLFSYLTIHHARPLPLSRVCRRRTHSWLGIERSRSSTHFCVTRSTLFDAPIAWLACHPTLWSPTCPELRSSSYELSMAMRSAHQQHHPDRQLE